MHLLYLMYMIICAYTHTHSYVNHIFIHTHTHTYIHTYIHTGGGSELEPHGGPPTGEEVINYIDCPPFATSIYECSFNTTNEGECGEHFYDAYVFCFGGNHEYFVSK